MSAYILSIVGVVFLTTIAGIILPEGKLGQYIKSIFAIISLVVIIRPIAMISRGEINFDDIFSESNSYYQEDYLNYVNYTKIQNYKAGLEENLANQGFKGVNSEIIFILEDYNIKITKVIINLDNLVIENETAHINIIEEIKQAVSKYLSIEKGQVYIYGE